MNRFIELKRSLPVNFTRELRGYFQKIYKTEREDEFDAELMELDKLRVECINPVISQSTINTTLLRYYLQLLDLENRVNLDAVDIKVPFAWYNCSAGDDKKIIVSAANIRFEEACILFNVAACYIQLAGMESTSTAEGLKKACNYYMMAAGVFQFISENLTSHFNVPTPADVSPTSLNFLLKWSLAAAQECFVLKGIAEKTIKDGMLAKLALATGQMYENAKELGEELGIGSIYGKSLAAFLLGRATYYKAFAQVKKASEALAANHYGEEISRLNEATTLLTRCKEHKRFMDSATLNFLDTLAGQVVKNLERAIKDNSIIYHETIPAITGLPEIGQAVVARATAMPDWSKDANVPSRPILARLVPETIRVCALKYYERRNAQVSEIYSRLSGLKQAEQEIMRECNLPGLLEGSQVSMGLPPSIIEKSQYVRSNGGAESLQSSLTTIDALKSDAKQLLKQVEDLLNEERMNDTQARQDFGTKWTRPESDTLAKTLRKALESYKKSFIEAGESDRKIQAEFNESIVGITSLDSSQTELEESIPACTSHNSQRGDASLARNLKSKLEIVNEFEGQRCDLIQRIEKYFAEDTVEESFTALGEEVLRDEEFAGSIISDRLNSEEFVKFFSEADSIECDQQIQLGELKQLAISFAASLTFSSAMEERQNALQTLDSAFLSFKNLSAQFQNAISFYSDLLDLLQKLRENTRDFTVSRGIELDELRNSLLRSRSTSTLYQNQNSPSRMQTRSQTRSPIPNQNGFPGSSGNNLYRMNNPNNINANYNDDYSYNNNNYNSINNYNDSDNYSYNNNNNNSINNYNDNDNFDTFNYNDNYDTFDYNDNTGNYNSSQGYMMPPIRGNASGSSYHMPQTAQRRMQPPPPPRTSQLQQQQQQRRWQPGMPVQYASNPNNYNDPPNDYDQSGGSSTSYYNPYS